MSSELPEKKAPATVKANLTIIASEYNRKYTQALVDNCLDELHDVLPTAGIEVIRVPGAYEIPVTASVITNRPAGQRPDVVIALGVIIKGATEHADLVGHTVAQALQDLAVSTHIPIINEVLLLEDEKQAVTRTMAEKLNRGRESARTAAAMATLFINKLQVKAPERTTMNRKFFTI